MKNEAQDFLIYSYFGIVPRKVFDEKIAACMKGDEYRDYRVKMAIMKAYDDATGQGAYNTLFNAKQFENFRVGVNELKETSKIAKNKAARAIFNSLKDNIEPGKYDVWHKKYAVQWLRLLKMCALSRKNRFSPTEMLRNGLT